MRYACPRCGTPAPDDVSKCLGCGRRFSTAPSGDGLTEKGETPFSLWKALVVLALCVGGAIGLAGTIQIILREYPAARR